MLLPVSNTVDWRDIRLLPYLLPNIEFGFCCSIAERTYTIINSESQAKPESGEGGEQSANSVTAEQTADQSEQETLSENEADTIITCLEEVLLLLKNANQIMVSAKVFFIKCRHKSVICALYKSWRNV